METAGNRIKKVLGAVFGLSPQQLPDKASPDSVEQWDSLGHMKMVAALEEEFDIRFDDTEILEMQNLPLIKLIVAERLKAVR